MSQWKKALLGCDKVGHVAHAQQTRARRTVGLFQSRKDERVSSIVIIVRDEIAPIDNNDFSLQRRRERVGYRYDGHRDRDRGPILGVLW